MNNIHTLTLNSAVEEVVFGAGETPDSIIHIEDKKRYLTGKAVNSGLLLSNINVKCNINVVCGNDTEEAYRKLNNAFRKVFAFPVKGMTRKNQTYVLTGDMEYKKINKGYSISDEIRDKLVLHLQSTVEIGDIILIAGSMPNGILPEWYKNMIEYLGKRGIKVMFDASNDELREGAKGSPYYIKPNKEELKSLIGEYKECELKEQLMAISEFYHIENVIVTLGKEGALGFNAKQNVCVKVHSEERFSSPIMTTGCGDSFNAGFIYGMLKDEGFINNLVYGIAFAGANIVAGFPEKVTMSIIKDRLKYVSYKII